MANDVTGRPQAQGQGGHDCEDHWGPRRPAPVEGAEGVVRDCLLCGRTEAVWVRQARPLRARARRRAAATA